MKGYTSYLSGNEQKAVDIFTRKIKALLGDNLEEIKIFGSKVRGDYRQDSDIDILLVLQKKNWELSHKIAKLATEIDLRFNCEISPAIYSSFERRKNQQMQTLFSQTLQKEGIPL